MADKVDLTRFDFNVHDFLNSEDVQAMSNAEVGEYILLLANAWAAAKEATIPDSPEILQRWAHTKGKPVSPKVMAKFVPIETEWGTRLQNPVLFRHWMDAKLRSNNGKKAADARWEQSRGNALASSSLTDGAAETIPNQSSNQTNQAIKPSGRGNFKFISAHYKSFFGITHSHERRHLEKYSDACVKYGEDAVLRYFDEWATQAVDWLKPKRDNRGLNFFYSVLDELAMGEELAQKREAKIPKIPDPKMEIALAAADAARQNAEYLADLAEKQEKEKERLQYAKDHEQEI